MCMNKVNTSILLLPLMKKEKVEEIIKKFDGEFLSSVVSREGFDDVLHKIEENAIMLVAIIEKEIVGFCAFYINDFISKTVYISLIAVAKKYQGRQVGTEILNYVKNIAKLNDFDKIRLEVDDCNEKGIHFYKKNGFEFEKKSSDNSRYMRCILT